MSRCGRSVELLNDWRDHPRGCTAEHGWADGYAGPCTDDAWEIVQTLTQIDSAFLYDQIRRLRAALAAGLTLEEHDVLAATNEGRRQLDALPRAVPAP